MPRTLYEHLSPDTGPKRLLALDGGGAKGVLTLGLLKPLEEELRRRAGDAPSFRLSDYYDLIAGGGSGAIIAVGLALGLSVDELIDFYLRNAPDIYGRWRRDAGLTPAWLDVDRLRRAVHGMVASRTLGSDDLKTGVAFFAKRADIGEAWIITNHPLAPDYDASPESGVFANKRHPLVNIVMASAGAPTLVDQTAVSLALDERRRSTATGHFAHGALSGAINPSLPMLALTLSPAQAFKWSAGADALMLSSFGAGMRPPSLEARVLQGLPGAARALHAIRLMTYNEQIQGVALMQALSAARKPWPCLHQTTDWSGVGLTSAPLLDYQRIDVALDTKPRVRKHGDPQPPMTPLERLLGRELRAETLNALDGANNAGRENLDLLLEIGQAAGRTFVDGTYPNPHFNLAEWKPAA